MVTSDTELPEGLTRVWRLLAPDGGQHCVGVVVEGPALHLAPNPPPVPCVAVRSFAWLGTPVRRQAPDGTALVAMPVLDGPPPREIEGAPCASLAEALAWLDVGKRELLDAGWVELAFDVANDPD